MDIIDRAQAAETKLRDQALKNQAASRSRGVSREKCVDCGDKIPQARREAAPGCRRCIQCEEKHERNSE